MTETTLYQVEDGWIELSDGTAFRFGAEPEELAKMMRVETIARTLARLCRYNGHTRRWYSVLEHAIIMADVAEELGHTPRECLTVLHHDDAEHIIGDLPRPIKVKMPQFKSLETRLDQGVAIKFGTIYPLPDWLKEYDARILRDERAAVMSPSAHNWGTDGLDPLGVRFMPIVGRWFPWWLERRFLERHHRWSIETEEGAWASI